MGSSTQPNTVADRADTEERLAALGVHSDPGLLRNIPARTSWLHWELILGLHQSSPLRTVQLHRELTRAPFIHQSSLVNLASAQVLIRVVLIGGPPSCMYGLPVPLAFIRQNKEEYATAWRVRQGLGPSLEQFGEECLAS
ncbi:hypothetical protein H920_04257 [Fukomys damarensis]|uniref:Uncharacterized protein n=1 Tax=Fukomys damarensis TaxID=885580 RepID=A0A091EG14_FUKDA|nr:hypothetical protein H920_04257 [Fukomys damarensis]